MTKTVQAKSKKYATNNYLVFVSHATADKWIARMLCEKIEETGAKAFRDDRDINGGDDIPEEIRRQIVKSNEMIVIFSPESFNRPWVLLEIGAAWGRRQKTRIVAVLCHVEVDNIPDIISSKKTISINDVDDYFIELKRRVNRER